MRLRRQTGALCAILILFVCLTALVSPRSNAEVRLKSLPADPASVRLYGHGRNVPIGPDLAEELRCLALNIYFEARSEQRIGQIAVAMVTLNRTTHRKFPDTICGVVRQGGDRRRNGCQFSWYCDGKRDEPTNQKAWRRSQELARRVVFSQVDDPTGGALWYHADYVKPRWTQRMRRTVRIGRHYYYTISG